MRQPGWLLFTGCWVLLSCAPEEAAEDARDASFSDGKADRVSIAEASPEAFGVLRVANELGPGALHDDVGLSSRTVRYLVEHRAGSDGVDGTDDDDAYDTLAELDAVPYVGPVALDRMLAYARAQGWVVVPSGPVTILSIDPPAGASGVSRCPTVRVKLSRPVDEMAARLAIQVQEDDGNFPAQTPSVPADVSVKGAIATWTPRVGLRPYQRYNVEVGKEIFVGELPPFSSSRVATFVTAADYPSPGWIAPIGPVANTLVPGLRPISALICANLDAPPGATIAMVDDGGGPVALVPSFDDATQVLTLTPAAEPRRNATVSVTLGGLHDRAGAAVAPATWSYRTAALAPVIVAELARISGGDTPMIAANSRGDAAYAWFASGSILAQRLVDDVPGPIETVAAAARASVTDVVMNREREIYLAWRTFATDEAWVSVWRSGAGWSPAARVPANVRADDGPWLVLGPSGAEVIWSAGSEVQASHLSPEGALAPAVAITEQDVNITGYHPKLARSSGQSAMLVVSRQAKATSFLWRSGTWGSAQPLPDERVLGGVGVDEEGNAFQLYGSRLGRAPAGERWGPLEETFGFWLGLSDLVVGSRGGSVWFSTVSVLGDTFAFARSVGPAGALGPLRPLFGRLVPTGTGDMISLRLLGATPSFALSGEDPVGVALVPRSEMVTAIRATTATEQGVRVFLATDWREIVVDLRR